MLFLSSYIANAQGFNPSGSSATVNSGSYNFSSIVNGYNNYGTLKVEPGSPGNPQFDGDFLGLFNGGGTASVSGGFFEHDYTGFDTEHGKISVSGGSFGNNTYGLFNNLQSTATVSGGSFHNNGIGLLNWSSVASVTGGSFSANGTDIVAIAGTVNLYGTAFSKPFGDLAGGSGTLTWTQVDGSVQTLSYVNYGTIDLIKVAPTVTPEPSPFVSIGILLANIGGALVICARKRRASRIIRAD